MFLFVSLRNDLKPFDISQLIDSNSQSYVQYKRFQERFKEDDVLVLGFQTKDNSRLTTEKIFHLSNKIKHSLESLAEIKSITTPLDFFYFKFRDKKFSLQNFFTKGEDTQTQDNALKSKFFQRKFTSKNQDAFLIFLTLQPSNTRADIELKPLLEKINSFSFNNKLNFHHWGNKSIKYHFTLETLRSNNLVMPILFLVLGVLFFLFFKSFKIVALFYFITFLGFFTQFISIFLIDNGLGPFSSMSLLFLLIIGTSDQVHFYSSYLDTTGSVSNRIAKTLDKIKRPCFFTTVTTSLAFCSLIFSGMRPIQMFGIYCAFGSIFAYFFSIYFLPFFIKTFQIKLPTKQFNNYLLEHFSSICQKYKKVTVLVFLALTFISLIFLPKIKIDDNVYDKFIPHHPYSKSVNFFKENFNIIGQIKLIIANSEKFLSENFLDDIENTEKHISKLKNFKEIDSLIELRRYLTQTLDSKQSANRIIKLLYRNRGITQYYSKNDEYIFNVTLKDLSSKSSHDFLESIEKIPNNKFKIQPTGFILVRNHIFSKLASSFLKSFLFNFCVIFIVFMILLRSFKLSLVAMIPNIFPFVILIGALGIFEFNIDSNFIILVSIAMGISIDDTIHFLDRYHREIQTKSFQESIDICIKETGKALSITTLIFILSLPVFFLGSLKVSSFLAIFISLTLLSALLCDLLLLPALLRMMQITNFRNN